MRETTPSAGRDDPGEAVKQAAAMAANADKIADALADAKAGLLESAGFDYLKNRYRVGAAGADLIRAALIEEGRAIKMPNGRVELV